MVSTGIGIGIGIGGLKSDGLAAPTVRTEKSYPAYGWFGQSVGWRTSTGAPYMTVSV